MNRLVLLCLSISLLPACGEKDQSQAEARKGPDAKLWQGTNNPYVVKGWSVGDKTSWEGQLKARAQTQNEYAKAD